LLKVIKWFVVQFGKTNSRAKVIFSLSTENLVKLHLRIVAQCPSLIYQNARLLCDMILSSFFDSFDATPTMHANYRILYFTHHSEVHALLKDFGVLSLLLTYSIFSWPFCFLPLTGQVIVNTKTISCTPGLEDCLIIENVNIIQPDSFLYLSFRHKCLPCGILFRNCRSVMFETTYRDIFGEGIFKKLLTGQIISKP
jgi:hypothetical protein